MVMFVAVDYKGPAAAVSIGFGVHGDYLLDGFSLLCKKCALLELSHKPGTCNDEAGSRTKHRSRKPNPMKLPT
jgi:hypothetical protein